MRRFASALQDLSLRVAVGPEGWRGPGGALKGTGGGALQLGGPFPAQDPGLRHRPPLPRQAARVLGREVGGRAARIRIEALWLGDTVGVGVRQSDPTEESTAGHTDQET